MGINAVSADHLPRGSGAFRAPPVFPGLRRFDIIQMMHGSEWTLKYDEPEVENAHEGAARVRHFQPPVHYFNAQSLPCIICIQYTACCRRIYSVSAIIYNSS